MKLFIGSLPYNITETQLSELCGSFGSVVSAKLIVDQFSGQPKDDKKTRHFRVPELNISLMQHVKELVLKEYPKKEK